MKTCVKTVVKTGVNYSLEAGHVGHMFTCLVFFDRPKLGQISFRRVGGFSKEYSFAIWAEVVKY